jgi:DNA-binding XRE family transcriptional regulator
LERKLSQENLAEFVGISVDVLSLMEHGINAPSFETIGEMARKLRVPAMEIFDFAGQYRTASQRKKYAATRSIRPVAQPIRSVASMPADNYMGGFLLHK